MLIGKKAARAPTLENVQITSHMSIPHRFGAPSKKIQIAGCPIIVITLGVITQTNYSTMASLHNVLVQGLAPNSLSIIPPISPNLPSLLVNGTDAFGVVDWIRAHPGGYFHSKQELRLQNADDPSSRWMLFATDDIPEGEVLSKIPWDLLIGPQDSAGVTEEDLTGSLSCDAARHLAHKLQAGSDSEYAPFLQYLSTIPPLQPQIPGAWSAEGKEVLVELLGGLDPTLPPGEPVHLLDEDWYRNCKGGIDGAQAATLLIQRGLFDTFMVPTYDWYTHRNGDYYNIRTEWKFGEYLQVSARRPIQKGEPLHNSYDMCDFCDEDAVENGYGTPELFRDYGIIEEFPQRWTFQPDAVTFELEGGGSMIFAPEQITFELVESNTEKSIKVKWDKDLIFDDRGRNYIRRIFRLHLRKLYRFQNIHYEFDGYDNETAVASENGFPSLEWKQIQAYYKALRSALQYAIHSLENDDDETGGECKEDLSSNEGVCEADHIDVYGIHYDDLKSEPDTLNYIFPGCSTTQILEFHEYAELEDVQTNYQKLWFVEREEDGDVCMNLENTLQICSNYRPHYHEFFVHFPARFIESIERVIFIGGGDSMLLHEVLKYPTLKKVVGLELDQQVTRKSFHYFKSQPHWDNDKVEWWYGDATKSLPLLPRDYWGSFDLVLVDLSETVMSFSVTKTMDIFSALSLLLKPEGIMVKNEPYIEQFSDFFDYSMHIFYGTPKICTQVLVMGSNQVDFLHHPTKDHKVERLLLEPLDDYKKMKYKYMHDYRKTNALQQGKCQVGDVSIEHGSKAGIIEIVEAENISYDFETNHLESTIHNVASKIGLTPLAPSMIHSKDPICVLVLKEGYVVARSTPFERHIAFDLHLWGAYDKLEALREALLEAVGSQRSSFYRVVAGGMHGTSTWDDDEASIGIRVSQTRNCKDQELMDIQVDHKELAQAALQVSLEESLRFVSKNDQVLAVVLCGYKSENSSCATTDILSRIDSTKVQVEPIWACPELSNSTDLTLDSVDDMYECEKSVIRQLIELVANDDDGDIDMVVIDPTAPLVMGQILNSVMSPLSNREALLEDRNVFVAFSKASEKEDSWRKNVLERYRKESHFFPVSRAEVTLTASVDVAFELHLTAVDDRYFFQHLHDLESAVRSKLVRGGEESFQSVEVKTITGGLHYYDSEYDEKTFLPDAYDAQPALDQANEQKPLGRQSIFQFENLQTDDGSPSSAASMVDRLNESLQDTIKVALGIDAKAIRRWSTFRDVGDGVVIVANFKSGCVILLWDGWQHVDVNLYNTNQEKATADLFVDTFAEKTGLTKTLRDDQPRGPGRVVQFQDEIESAGRT